MSVLEGLRIAFVAGTLGQGGAERQLFYILKTLKEQGAYPRVLCLTRGEFWEERIRALGVPVVWVGKSSNRMVRLAHILWELQRHRVDIVQSQHFYTNLYVALAARLLRLKGIGAVRNDSISEVRTNGRCAGYLHLRFPQWLAANSQAGLGNAVALGVKRHRLFFLPNVIDVEHFRPPDPGKCEANKKTRIRVLAVGRLVRQKRMDRFLQVLSQLRSRVAYQVEGLIVGDGPLRPVLERQARSLKLLPNTVQFRGQVADVRSVYPQADIFVLTSDWEGTPNVVMEAMASRLPVVASAVGDVPRLIQHGVTGYVINPNDEDAFVEALLSLIQQPEQRRIMGRRAREHIEEHYSLERLPDYLSRLYQQVLA